MEIELYVLYLLNGLPNWSVSGHICMRKSVNRSNDHRPLDKQIQVNIII